MGVSLELSVYAGALVEVQDDRCKLPKNHSQSLDLSVPHLDGCGIRKLLNGEHCCARHVVLVLCDHSYTKHFQR
jgi:hypothetical protein